MRGAALSRRRMRVCRRHPDGGDQLLGRVGWKGKRCEWYLVLAEELVKVSSAERGAFAGEFGFKGLSPLGLVVFSGYVAHMVDWADAEEFEGIRYGYPETVTD